MSKDHCAAGIGLVAFLGLVALGAARASAQVPSANPDVNPGQRMAFDVTSVKIDSLGLPPAGPKQSLTANGGTFSMTNCGVFCLIGFAYNLTPNELADVYSQIPREIFSERFDAEARAAGDPKMDEMRLMAQSLLADRFKLAMHYEMRTKPVYNLVLAKAGKLGPQLRAYTTSEAPCVDKPTPRQTVADGFPAVCGNRDFLQASQPGNFREGGRNMSLAQISALFRYYGHLDRIVIDQTGLTGPYDFILEWEDASAAPAQTANDSTGPTFLEALRDQLGLKLEAATAPVKTFVIDHIEQPTPN